MTDIESYFGRFTIVIATRNRFPQLRLALPTMLDQKGAREILIADDGSTDATRKWLRKREIPFLALKNRRYSLNPSRAYSPLIDRVQTEFIVFSSGEICLPDDLGAAKLVSRCDPSTISLAQVVNQDNLIPPPPGPDWLVNPDPETWRIRGHEDYWYTSPQRPAPFMFLAAFPKSLWEYTGGYDPALKNGVDVEFATRAMDMGISFQGVGDVSAIHLIHGKK